jgi:hypothetical protein
MNFAAHDMYADDANIVNQGADFAASRLQGSTRAPLSVPSHGFGS